ncbi:hypothetical protein [Butyrivibrio sp. FC2001]|uniref:hypothetical protein n=1 Tax=Butyrivibrio sp. FC2001 TaxID=1280671 RepID=UPI0003FEA31D|nr:hypothetical protein [Butyrivibrio sp. FC2001]
MKKILFYFASAILLFAYIWVLFLSMDTSNVDDSYDLFYLQKELKYYSAEEELLEYCENVVFEYTKDGNNKNLGWGWDNSEENGTWSIGNNSTFFILVNNPDDLYDLQIKINDGAGYKNNLFLNGEKIGTILPGENEYHLRIDKYLTDGFNKFEIVSDEEVIPYNEKNAESGDKRKLNILVNTITLKSL